MDQMIAEARGSGSSTAFATNVPPISSVSAGKTHSLATDWGVLRAPDQSGLSYSWVDSGPMVPPMTAGRAINLFMKRFLDVAITLSALVVLAPLLLAVALIIKLTSRGPVLFRQMRVGLDNQGFEVFKFRSMYVDQGDHSGVAQTVSGDPRVTAVGRFIRKTSIDELPQLINILRGDMSLVGPRPHVPGQLASNMPYQVLVPYYAARHVMRPGLTGWAQANGFRGPTVDPVMARGRVDHDMAYIQNFSVLLDIKILFKTVWREFFTGSGY